MKKNGTERVECVKCMRHLCGTELLAVAYIFYVEKSTMIVMAMAMAKAMAQQDNLNIYIHHIHSLTPRCHLKTWRVCVRTVQSLSKQCYSCLASDVNARSIHLFLLLIYRVTLCHIKPHKMVTEKRGRIRRGREGNHHRNSGKLPLFSILANDGKSVPYEKLAISTPLKYPMLIT